MADKTEKAVDLGILEEDDEFEEFPAEDWKENTDTDPKNVSSSVNFWSKLEFYRLLGTEFRKGSYTSLFCTTVDRY